ncbi:MAG: class I SAM-dependent methyltransferase [Actinomycetota bacterium]
MIEPQLPDDAGSDTYRANTYGDAFADVYDDWYADVSDVDATVAAIARLAGDGTILELGVGTGRLALPLAATGVKVVGVDASQAMLDLLADKAGAGDITVALTDMADLDAAPGIADHGPYAVAFAAFNTFFNLTSDDAQAACLQALHRLVRPDGVIVIEGFVPPEDGLNDGGVSVRDVTATGAVITISKHDAVAQIIRGHHVEITAAGNRLRPWMLHYRTPEQLDAAADDAGFTLRERWSDWHGTPYSAGADLHISVYERR